MNKYSRGKIYIIKSPNHDKVYYGSTTYPLKKRFAVHKADRQCLSRKIIDAGDADIFEIEPFPCTCKVELQDREAEFIIANYDDCVNVYIPGAMKRAGGRQAYMKAQNAKPERKAKKKTYNQKPESKAKRKAYSQQPEIRARKAEKIMCNVCGCMISRKNISAHKKTKTCQNHLKSELDKVMEDIISSIETKHLNEQLDKVDVIESEFFSNPSTQ